MKNCNKCNIERPINFYRVRDGYVSNICKFCVNKQKREKYNSQIKKNQLLIKDYDNEKWVYVDGSQDMYMVSNFGRIKSVFRNENYFLKPRLTEKGYNSVSFRINGKRFNFKTHRLVAKHFIPNPENKPQINHINGIKTDNRVENLEWVNNSENQQHAIRNGLRKGHEVVKLDINGNELEKYKSIGQASKNNKIPIYKIIKSCKVNSFLTNGFKWKYLIMLIPFLTFGQTTPKWVTDLENSTELNKAQHYWVSHIGSTLIGTSINHYIDRPGLSSLSGGIIMFGVGLGKEYIWDYKMKRGVKSGGDIFMNGFGCIVGMMNCRVVIDIRESGLKKRKDKYEY